MRHVTCKVDCARCLNVLEGQTGRDVRSLHDGKVFADISNSLNKNMTGPIQANQFDAGLQRGAVVDRVSLHVERESQKKFANVKWY